MVNCKYKIVFHENEKGESESYTYIEEMAKQSLKSKNARVKYNKITEYMHILSTFGLAAGYPYIKAIKTVTGLYELRPNRDRFFFLYEDNNIYVILNHFIKDTNKTPAGEIQKAVKMIKERNKNI